MHYDEMNSPAGLSGPRPRGRPAPLASAGPAATLVAGILLVNGAVVLWLLALGRGFLPASVPLEWWNPSTLAAHNSQHVTDAYSLLHAVSGAALYVAAGWLRPAWPFHRKLLMVLACSGVWEIVENTPWVIALFNDPVGAQVYRGDSIVNALSDTGFVALGVLAARLMPRWAVIGAGVLAEIGAAVMIHDSFVLGAARIILR